MAFDELHLNPYSGVRSTAGTSGMANLEALDNKALLALERSKYWEDKRRESADIYADAALGMYQPKETSWGDVAMGVFNSANDAGLFSGNGGFGMPSFGQAKADAAEYDWGTDAGYGGDWSGGGTPNRSDYGNAWYNPFGWGS
tara:strand:+ start:1551 stop:1979 length:429 start_codon:yes stop_codon:yes gene_type:complete